MKRIVLCILAVVIVAAPASATDRGFYVGGGLGLGSYDVADFNPELSTLRFEEDGFGFKLFGGYRILKYLAVEVAYTDYGDVTMRETATWLEHQRLDVGIQALDVSAVGIIPFSRKVMGFGKVGVASWNADVRQQLGDDIEDQSRDGTDLVFGMGLHFLLNKFGIRLELDWQEMKDANGAFMVSGALGYHF